MTSGRWLCIASVLAASTLLLAHSAAAKGGKGGGAAVVIDSVQFFDLQGVRRTSKSWVGASPATAGSRWSRWTA